MNIHLAAIGRKYNVITPSIEIIFEIWLNLQRFLVLLILTSLVSYKQVQIKQMYFLLTHVKFMKGMLMSNTF